MSSDPDLDLTRRLTAVADRAPYAAPDVALDLARGRRRLRRRRAAAVAGAVGVVAAVSVAVTVLPGGTDLRGGRGPEPAGQGTAPTVAVDRQGDPDADAVATERALGFGEGLDLVTVHDQLDAAAQGYAQVLAERLDPQGRHAVLPTENTQSASGAGRGVQQLGTRVGWRQPGAEGQGVVAVTVGRTAASSEWSCADPTWSCADLPAPDGATARVATHDDSTEVAVRRDDGSVVTIATATLDAGNSRTAIGSVDLTVEQLLAAALDPRLVLPDVEPTGAAPGERDLAGADLVRSVGAEVLLPAAPGETAGPVSGGADGDGGYSFLNTVRWSGPGGAGDLGWSIDGDPSVRLGATCERRWFSRCVVHTEAGREVFVGWLRGGRGWRVWAPGLVQTLQVDFTGTGYPVERALDLVLDPRLQQPG